MTNGQASQQMTLDDALNMAVRLHQGGKLEEAANLYEQILLHMPDHPYALHFLGVISDQKGDPARGVELIRRAIAIMPDDAEAHNNLGLALIATGQRQEALEQFEQAVKLDKNYAQAWYNVGWLKKDLGQYEESITAYQHAVAAAPNYAEAFYNLGNLHQARGNQDEAEKAYRAAVAAKPHYAQAYNNLGMALQYQNRPEEAAEAYQQAISLKPDYAEAHANLSVSYRELKRDEDAQIAMQKAITLSSGGDPAELARLSDLLKESGKMEEARIAYLKAACKRQPKDAEAWFSLGNALVSRAADVEEAVFCYQQALSLQPNHISAIQNLGAAYDLLARYAEAEETYQRGLALLPNDAKLWKLLGKVRSKSASFTAAEEAYQKAATLMPFDAEAVYLLGTVYQVQRKWHEAMETFRRSATLNPDFAKAHAHMGAMRLASSQLPEAIACFRKAAELDGFFLANVLFALHCDPEITPQALYREAVEWGEKHAPVSLMMPPPKDRDRNPDRRLRVGFVSADFRNHPVSSFLETVFASLDRSKIELFCYVNQAERDEVTERLQQLADHWQEVYRFSDDELATHIRRDAIDVLVDLSGHTAYDRLLTFARKPAPVQATWLGYFDTTGVKAIDYIIADQWVIPQSETGQYVETPYRMPDSYLCFTPPEFDLAVSAPPMEKNGYITFGCFNYISKVNRNVVHVWANIMKQAPGSHLFLKTQSLENPQIQKQYTEWFAQEGIDAERLRLEGPAARQELMRAYNEVDVALDPFPYNGGTTTLEALYMGVPVVTKSGDRFVSHVSESILQGLGMPEMISTDEAGYVRTAVSLAQDAERMKTIRSGLRQKLLDSPMCDAPRFARNLEAAFRAMWQAWCRGETLRA